MTDTGPGPSQTTGSGSGPAPDPGPARRQALSELRRRHPRWVVLWLTRTGLYHGYPLYTQRLVGLSSGQPAELPP
jgi:hypothetical protein